jgi:hypothetical protein
MTVQSVIREVCAYIGVRPPVGSVFVTPEQSRTAWELLNLANEMAQRIAYNTRDWTVLRKLNTFTGPGTIFPDQDNVSTFILPTDYHRMLKSMSVYRSARPTVPMRFISDPDQWLQRRLAGRIETWGEWSIFADDNGAKAMHICPKLGAFVAAVPPDPLADPPIAGSPAIPAETAKFFYLRNTCVSIAPPNVGFADHFTTDNDTFVLPERLLRLGMIWQWKAYKGGAYAEDIANYEDALNELQGNDKPSPIIIGGQAQSGSTSYPYPTPSMPETPYPGDPP